MKATAILIGAAAVIALGLYGMSKGYERYAASWQAKQEQIATGRFQAKRADYEQLLSIWTRLFPEKCGSPHMPTGLVSVAVIRPTGRDTYSFSTNDSDVSSLTVDGLSKLLKADSEDVRLALALLRSLPSQAIAQSGAVVNIVSPENDTHGVLHVDSSCPDARQFAFWERTLDHFSYTGHYFRLKGLGDGWYYYVEQR